MDFEPASASMTPTDSAIGDHDEEEGLDGSASAALDITVASHLMRCGKQVKLVLDANTSMAPEPHPKLVEMILQARRWFADLSSGNKYINCRHCRHSQASTEPTSAA